MKNTILKYDRITSIKFDCGDYTSKKFRIVLEMTEVNDTNYIEYIELYDNQTIEQVSFILYGSADYWDILVLINDIDPIFDMSYEYDILSDISVRQVTKYLADYSGVYRDDTFDRLNSIKLTQNIENNEKNRKIKVIKPSRLFDFITKINELDI